MDDSGDPIVAIPTWSVFFYIFPLRLFPKNLKKNGFHNDHENPLLLHGHLNDTHHFWKGIYHCGSCCEETLDETKERSECV